MAIEAMTQTTIRQAEGVLESPFSGYFTKMIRNWRGPPLLIHGPLLWSSVDVDMRAFRYSAARRCGVEAVMIHGDAHPSSR